ncbi:uncharacterized protein LOC133422431 isoform X2 [Cololabis saira]|uniref:uncharacterized protein LOC133422431 isoform X2 n=1 Tax=Cololabis saira TaxID=129043 RepID=UPI002AD404B7|nr:uncharacterized protein LOC133422431 isoform X2 [Cololabis saira]
MLDSVVENTSTSPTDELDVKTTMSAVTVSMSAAWLKIAIFVCLSYIARTDGGTKKVIWKEAGESITIECSSSQPQESMYLYTGLYKSVELVFISPPKVTVTNHIKARVQTYIEFPKISVLIKNLTVNDTGTYWCVYMNYINLKEVRVEGDGSLLLVVTGKKGAPTVATVTQQCEPLLQGLLTGALVISGVVTLCVVVACCGWIIFKKPPCTTQTRQSKRAVGNDVYEDMRGTLRR